MWIPSDLPSMPWRSFCRVWWFSVICELLTSMLFKLLTSMHRNTSRFSVYNALISSLCWVLVEIAKKKRAFNPQQISFVLHSTIPNNNRLFNDLNCQASDSNPSRSRRVGPRDAFHLSNVLLTRLNISVFRTSAVAIVKTKNAFIVSEFKAFPNRIFHSPSVSITWTKNTFLNIFLFPTSFPFLGRPWIKRMVNASYAPFSNKNVVH